MIKENLNSNFEIGCLKEYPEKSHENWIFDLTTPSSLTWDEIRKNEEFLIFFDSLSRWEGSNGEKRGLEISNISRTKSNRIRCNPTWLKWHSSMLDDIKFQNLKRSKFVGDCWIISLEKENLSLNFERQDPDINWRDSHAGWTIGLVL